MGVTSYSMSERGGGRESKRLEESGKRRGVGRGSVCDGARLRVASDALQVAHGSVEGQLHGFLEAGAPGLRQLGSVQCRVDPEGRHLGPRKPLPDGREDGV